MVTSMVNNARKNTNESRFYPLFVGALSGDRQAYSHLLSGIAELAKGYVQRKMDAHADCEDVVQDILTSIHKSLHTYDPGRPCMPWLAAIIHYRLSDWLRKHYTANERRKASLKDIEEALSERVTEEPLAYEYVNKAVAELSEKQKAVIKAMYHQDLTVAETSEKLGMSISAVKTTAHRAYKKLRKRIDTS